jgi:hypothetical protein
VWCQVNQQTCVGRNTSIRLSLSTASSGVISPQCQTGPGTAGISLLKVNVQYISVDSTGPRQLMHLIDVWLLPMYTKPEKSIQSNSKP